jgi:peptidoglycan hydrolase CwlO-like protein
MGDTIFVAQLWVGKKSIMAVEAEMMGEQTPEADDLFASILKTIGYDESPEEKAEREKAEKQKAEAETNPQETKPQEKTVESETPAPPQSTETPAP